MKITASTVPQRLESPPRMGCAMAKVASRTVKLLLDVRGVMGEDAAGQAGNGAANAEGRHLGGSTVDAYALRGNFILADSAPQRADAAVVERSQGQHDQRHQAPDQGQNLHR